VRRLQALIVLAVTALAAATAAGARTTDVHLNLVAYSTPSTAYAKLIPAFQATAAGKGVSFSQSYGGSTDQSRAVASGLPADVVALSLAPDVDSLVAKGLVSSKWAKAKDGGMVSDSVVVFVVRNGNPKHIKGWNDLVRKGVQVVTPNPIASGGARWNIMAAYGAQLKLGKKPAEAVDYLKKLFGNVVAQDKSARTSLQTFLSGKGDVLLTYENEAILAQHQGQKVFYVIPRSTIKIENPVAVTTTGSADTRKAAQAFVQFLHTPQAQQIFGEEGYRPVDPKVAAKFKYPSRPGLFDIGFVGGWDKVTKQFFDPDNGIVTKIEGSLGVS